MTDTPKPRRRAPARRPATRRPRADKTAGRTIVIAAAGAVGALAAGVFGALKLGWLDRALGRPDGAEHAAPDLALDAPTPGTDRAPLAFRPDPTAAVPDSEREALRPATGPAPTLAATAGTVANQAD
ncbi:hypothetical protein ASG29_08975 [Sphingomonas sp. Leaf412]|uniref:hypothetical protein n=1 Tax=Sphingomonas sp. Leaf412 TaxID=1736370 RepID=UPI0006FAAC3B|nr:hypothetical protein [Sphingomonas sp. Leaf412]KQT31985.1 hypothetical protein ASG29_08975 [Sphingomonas sp. Leaf412]